MNTTKMNPSDSEKMAADSPPLSPSVDIGHVHLKVSDLDRAIAFYRDVIGFEVTQRYGDQAAFLSAGGYHHHLGLNTWESEGATNPPRHSTGLYHFAIRYPTRRDLALAYKRLIDNKVPIQGASDHGVSEAIYLSDPDQNGVELMWDRPRNQWPTAPEGGVAMFSSRLDLADLLAELDR